MCQGKKQLAERDEIMQGGLGETHTVFLEGHPRPRSGGDAVVASEEGIGYRAETPFLLHVCPLYGHTISPRAHLPSYHVLL